jgi:guanidinobutyrase
MIRPYNMATGAAPFDSLSVADIGDVAINTFNLLDAVRIIEEAYDKILEHNVIPMTLGGDHTITLPILRAIHKKHGKVGLVHIDAHADVNDHMFGEKIAHGTTFRRAVEEGLLDCDRVVQIGLRAQGYTADDFNWSRKQGFRVVQAEECWHKSLAPLMAEVREKVGGGPVYLSFDIDGIDPAWAPGTGTPEIGGLTTIQAIEIIRGCQGLDLIGCDLVEVSPPYDTTGNTSLLAPTCCTKCSAYCPAWPPLMSAHEVLKAADLVSAFARNDREAYFGAFSADASFVFYTLEQPLLSRCLSGVVGQLAPGRWFRGAVVHLEQRCRQPAR